MATRRRIRRRNRLPPCSSSPTPSPAPRASSRRRCATPSPRRTFETFFGRIKFDEAGRNIAKPMVLTQMRGGRYVVVAAQGVGGREPVIPRPRQ